MVTAQKRAQTTIDVAQSLSVITGETLEREQATTFADYLKLVPSLQLVQSTPGEGRLVLRGLDTGGVASTVAVYIDETPFGSSSGLVNGAVLAGDFDTFDMARVEVLRGPQGALYGASSLGGLLKFVTNAPDTSGFQMRARAGAASVDGGGVSYRSNLMVNAPISDTLAFRASGSYTREPGFIDSIGTGGSDHAEDINKSRNYGGRASLLYTPSKDLSVRVSAVAQNIEVDASSAVESDPVTLETLYGRQTQSQFVPQSHNVNYRVYNATVNWNMGWASLTSSTSSSTQKQTFRDDATYNLSGLVEGAFGTPNELYLGQNTNLKKFTQELRLSSNQPGMVDWLAGLYYTNEDGLVKQRYVAVDAGHADADHQPAAAGRRFAGLQVQGVCGVRQHHHPLRPAVRPRCRCALQPQPAGRRAGQRRRAGGRRRHQLRQLVGACIHLRAGAEVQDRRPQLAVRARRQGLPPGRPERAAAESAGRHAGHLPVGHGDEL
jgi:iron complex outermembrane receptor protein